MTHAKIAHRALQEPSPAGPHLRLVAGPEALGIVIPLIPGGTTILGREGSRPFSSRRWARHHVLMRWEGGKWMLHAGRMSDDSPALVLVNEERRGDGELLPGDRIEAAGYRFVFLQQPGDEPLRPLVPPIRLAIRKGPSPINPVYFAEPGESFILGKSPTASWLLASDHVSRHHARVEVVGEEWAIRDLESRNGTFVNGHRIREAPIRHLDRILMGEYDVIVRIGVNAGGEEQEEPGA